MIEAAAGTVRTPAELPAGQAAARFLGSHIFEGEIVDSKCFLGVMKPGSWKPHRGCAVRCLSGGVPPLFVVRDQVGPISQLLLVSSDGSPIGRRLLAFVAEPLAITGGVFAAGDRLELRADLDAIRRLE